MTYTVSFFFVSSLRWAIFLAPGVGDVGALVFPSLMRPLEDKFGNETEVSFAKLVGGRCCFLMEDVRNRAGEGWRPVSEETDGMNLDFDPPCHLGLSVHT